VKTPSLFEYRDYKAYLRAWIASRPGGGRGERSRLAERLRIHSAYISQVLRARAQLSLEQAIEASAHFGHSSEERRFFLLLVERARAGSPELERHFDEQIAGALEKRLNLKNRLEYKRALSPEDQSVYYGSWHYGAIFALASVPGFDTAEKIAARLGLARERAGEALEFLLTRGILVRDGKRLKPGTTSIHLPLDSPLFPRHHASWRLEAVRSLDRLAPESLHYSSVVSIAAHDVPRARAVLVRAIEEVRAIVRDSPEEDVYSYTLDLFRVGV
jgi:uncharacterized protein (TIGR02147 family)